MKNELKQAIDNDFFKIHTTDKGHSICYVPKEDILIPVNPDECIEYQNATKLVFYFNFGISMPMMDFIESYGIISDLELTNYCKQLICYPNPEFDYSKMINLFNELASEFDL